MAKRPKINPNAPTAKVVVEVFARRFIPGTTRTEDFTFKDEVEGHVGSKSGMLMACVRNYGRCRGRVYNKKGEQVGWQFEGREKTDAGDERWWETRVVVKSGMLHVGMHKEMQLIWNQTIDREGALD